MDVTAIGRLLAADGAEPTLVHRLPLPWRRAKSGTGTPPEQYTVVPSHNSPRLLVPSSSRRHAAAATGAATRASSWRAWLRQRATHASFAAGLGDLLFRDRLLPAVPATLARHLSEVLGQPLRLGLRLGPPRANQKPVLVLLDPAAQVVGYAKLAINPLTRELLAVERAALTELSRSDLQTLRVPRVRHAGQWRDAELLVVSALPVRQARSAASARSASLVAAAAAEVARLRPTTVVPLSESRYLSALSDQVTALPDDRHRRLLRDTLARAADTGARLEFGCWHGDFFAGNLAVHGRQVLAWDWERFAADVPVGYDALHHAFNSALLLRGRPLAAAAERVAVTAQRLLAPLRVPASHAGAVAALYLVEIATRYRRDGNRAVAGDQPEPAQWLPAALRRLAERSLTDRVDTETRRS